jgi:hypothetical protein
LIDGVPDSIRSNPMAMRTLLAKVKQNPSEKIENIQSMVKKLSKAHKLKEFDIALDLTP